MDLTNTSKTGELGLSEIMASVPFATIRRHLRLAQLRWQNLAPQLEKASASISRFSSCAVSRQTKRKGRRALHRRPLLATAGSQVRFRCDSRIGCPSKTKIRVAVHFAIRKIGPLPQNDV